MKLVCLISTVVFTLVISPYVATAQREDMPRVPALTVRLSSGESAGLLDLAQGSALTAVLFYRDDVNYCRSLLNHLLDIRRSHSRLRIVLVVGTEPSSLPDGESATVITDSSRQLWTALNVRAVPDLFIVDREGVIIGRLQGYVETQQARLSALVVDGMPPLAVPSKPAVGGPSQRKRVVAPAAKQTQKEQSFEEKKKAPGPIRNRKKKK